MNIICALFGHKEGRTYSVFKSTNQYLARCERCGKMVVFVNEDI